MQDAVPVTLYHIFSQKYDHDDPLVTFHNSMVADMFHVYKKGDVIFQQGHSIDYFYILLKGRAMIVNSMTGTDGNIFHALTPLDIMGLPDYLVMRQPFPGPGLAIRVLGEITREKLDTLRDADAIFREELANAGLAYSVSQYFAVLTNMRSVGVMGDGRTYDYTLALRGVTTTDFMTADFARIPYEVLEVISARIVNEVKNINRVVYDITTKPPATIEWE